MYHSPMFKSEAVMFSLVLLTHFKTTFRIAVKATYSPLNCSLARSPKCPWAFQCYPTQGRERPRRSQSRKRQQSQLVDCIGHTARVPPIGLGRSLWREKPWSLIVTSFMGNWPLPQLVCDRALLQNWSGSRPWAADLCSLCPLSKELTKRNVQLQESYVSLLQQWSSMKCQWNTKNSLCKVTYKIKCSETIWVKKG